MFRGMLNHFNKRVAQNNRGSWGMVATTAAGVGASYLTKKNKKKGGVSQEAMLTDEQKEAMKMLSDYTKTGKFGNYTAGELYGGDLGDYNMTTAEQLGQNKLLDLVNSGMPELYGLGADEYKKILSGDEYDPYNEKGVYKGFKKNVLREADDAWDRSTRDLAVTGDLYSTRTGQDRADLAERTHDTLSNKLAELYDTYANRRYDAAGKAINAGVIGEEMMKDRIRMSQEEGALQRLLNDAKAKAKYADWNRARGEEQDTINTAKTIMNKNVNYGVKSMAYDEPSPFSGLLDTGLNIAGQYYGNKFGTQGALESLQKFGLLKGGDGTIGGTGKTQSQILGFNTRRYI